MEWNNTRSRIHSGLNGAADLLVVRDGDDGAPRCNDEAEVPVCRSRRSRAPRWRSAPGPGCPAGRLRAARVRRLWWHAGVAATACLRLRSNAATSCVHDRECAAIDARKPGSLPRCSAIQAARCAIPERTTDSPKDSRSSPPQHQGKSPAPTPSCASMSLTTRSLASWRWWLTPVCPEPTWRSACGCAGSRTGSPQSDTQCASSTTTPAHRRASGGGTLSRKSGLFRTFRARPTGRPSSPLPTRDGGCHPSRPRSRS